MAHTALAGSLQVTCTGVMVQALVVKLFRLIDKIRPLQASHLSWESWALEASRMCTTRYHTVAPWESVRAAHWSLIRCPALYLEQARVG